MKKLLVAVATAVVVSGVSIAPASAWSVEHVGKDCRINLTLNEMLKAARHLNMAYFVLSPEETSYYVDTYKDLLSRLEAELVRLKDGKASEATIRNQEAEIEGIKTILAAAEKCKEVPSANSEKLAGMGSLKSPFFIGTLAGLAGGIIGAILAILGMQNFRI